MTELRKSRADKVEGLKDVLSLHRNNKKNLTYLGRVDPLRKSNDDLGNKFTDPETLVVILLRSRF